MESRGYLPELCFLLGVEYARERGCGHRVRGVRMVVRVNVYMSPININKSRRHVARDTFSPPHGPRTLAAGVSFLRLGDVDTHTGPGHIYSVETTMGVSLLSLTTKIFYPLPSPLGSLAS